jgi:hypothetical protein
MDYEEILTQTLVIPDNVLKFTKAELVAVVCRNEAAGRQHYTLTFIT